MKQKRSLLIVPIVLIVVVAAGALLTRMRPKPQPVLTQTSLQAEDGIPVEVAPVTVRTVNDVLGVTGQIAADSVTNLSTKVPGKVQYVAVRPGQKVARGELVIQLDDADAQRQLEQAQAGVAQAQAGLQSAKARLTSARTTARVGDTQSAAAIANAQAGLKAARARLEQVTSGARRQERIQSQNAVAIAKANLDKAQSDYNRYKGLYDQGAVAAATLDIYKTQRDVAQSQYNNAQQAASLVEEGARTEEVRQAQAGVQQAQEALRSAQAAAETNVNRQEDVRAAQAGIAQAQAQLASAKAAVGIALQNVRNFKIFAPRSGSVTDRNVEPGQYVNPGTGLLTIVDLSTVYVQANVSETDVARVKAGMRALLNVDAYPGRTFAGRVESIVASADPASRTFTARIAIANPDGALKPGMFARANIITGKDVDALLVPKEAVINREGKSDVVRIVDKNKADVVPVTTGITVGNDIVVRSPALRTSDKVVTFGQESLTTGQTVSVTG